MELLAPELPLRNFGSPLDVDGAVLASPGTEGMPSLGIGSQPAAGRCSPELVSLPLQSSPGANQFLVSNDRVRRCTAHRLLSRDVPGGPFMHIHASNSHLLFDFVRFPMASLSRQPWPCRA